MRIEESFRIAAAIETVWDFISDPRKITSCFPAVQSVEVLDDSHYKVIVKQKVGFISATFQIHTEVLEKVAPHRLVLSNRGKTILGANGLMKSTDTIVLTPASQGLTEVQVTSDLTLGGQLAVLGAKLIEQKSKELVAEVTAKMRKLLESEPSHS